VDELAEAIADPVRRRILEMLRTERLPAGQIAGAFPISRPAISRHLRVLRECGLVRDTLVGRRRLYELDPSRLAPLTDWLAALTGPTGWERHMDALETEIYRTRRERRTRPATDQREEHPA
jgi:DNA-binding transcriptional ArsR family regulator